MGIRTERVPDEHSEDASDALTPRETEVLARVGEGRTNREIADGLGISRGAVRFHLKEIHSKLDTQGRREVLTRLGWLRGLIPFPFFSWKAVGSVASFAIVGTTLTVAALLTYVDESGADADRHATMTYTTWEGVTLSFFAVPGRISIGELQELNPGLGTGPLEAEIEVVVPVLPGTQRFLVEAQATSASSQLPVPSASPASSPSPSASP